MSVHDDVNPAPAQIAKGALEQVCSGARLDCLAQYYSPRFVDHVNDSEFRGHAGIQASVDQYRKILSDITITVVDQVIEGQRVVSRFVVSGAASGRPVRFNGITISHMEDGLVVEDWSVTDTLGMLRQLGAWRLMVALLRSLGRGPRYSSD